jgi:ADP-ribose pyrophosphatase YjhB (NUDIX family)
MFGLFTDKVEKYRKLKKSLSEKKDDLVKFCQEYNALIKVKSDNLNQLEDNLAKGDGLTVFSIDKLKMENTELNSKYLSETTKRGAEIMKLQRDIENLEKSDSQVKELSKYEVFFTKSDFENYIISLASKHKDGTITTEQLAKESRDLLKFKDLKVNGNDYKVKDNRQHYADMIITDKETDKIFLVKRNTNEEFEPGKWALPGGHVEPAENYMRASVRETLEETGFDIDPNTVSSAGVYEDEKVVIHYFTTSIDAENTPVLEGKELIQCDWRSLEDILNSDDLILSLRDNFMNIIKLPEKSVGKLDMELLYEQTMANVLMTQQK